MATLIVNSSASSKLEIGGTGSTGDEGTQSKAVDGGFATPAQAAVADAVRTQENTTVKTVTTPTFADDKKVAPMADQSPPGKEAPKDPPRNTPLDDLLDQQRMERNRQKLKEVIKHMS